MNKIRITKYNPNFRNDSGAYLKEEWISYYDIGKTFAGRKFSSKEYYSVEQKYIDAILLLLASFSSCTIRISNLENHGDVSELAKNKDTELIETYSKIEDLHELKDSDSTLPLIIKLILREYIWAELLIVDTPIKIIFGYDYYMYFSGIDCSTSLFEKIRKVGLFVENLSDDEK